MKAWRVHAHGEPKDLHSCLRWEDCATPSPPPDGVVIDVRAAGLNFSDLLLVAGKYQADPSLPFVLGMEAVGVVAAVGPKSRHRVGQRVIASALKGAFAEQMAASDPCTFAIPDAMSDVDAAALHVIYQTAYMALVYRCDLQPGETLLVHGGSGGVGTATIQVGKALGARVIATAGSSEKLAVCSQAGADQVIHYREQDFAQEVNALTDGRGADVIFDPVGGDVFDQSLRCIAFGGRQLVIGFASGRIPEITANRILLKNISIVGLHWPAYSAKAPELVQQTHLRLLELYNAGAIRPIIGSQRSMHELPKALTQIAERRAWGKLVVIGPHKPCTNEQIVHDLPEL